VAGWWADQLKAELSQGDLLSPVPTFTSVHPITSLVRANTKLKGVNDGWNAASQLKQDKDDLVYGLARGRYNKVVVLSQDCEIDKPGGKLPVQVAPVMSMSAVPDIHRGAIRELRRFPMFPLEAVPGILDEEGYVDLRMITHINRKIIEETPRIASMNDVGVRALQLQIFAFFTHRTLDEMNDQPGPPQGET
jgi:hypothetical protein